MTLPGTPLDDADLKTGAIFQTSYAPNLKYRWDTGAALGRYLAELKQGRLIARRCDQCQRVMIPPRMFCERCFRPTDAWVPLQNTGKVITFSLCHVTWNVTRLTSPEIPAVIAIDGASENMGILHKLKHGEPKEVRVGMAVRAIWKQPEQRTGSITDIDHWEIAS